MHEAIVEVNVTSKKPLVFILEMFAQLVTFEDLQLL